MTEKLYQVETEKAIAKIKEVEAKTVCIQLPDGLKPKATEIADKLKETGAEIHIWLGSNFGACDIPMHLNDFDLIVNFGHSKL